MHQTITPMSIQDLHREVASRLHRERRSAMGRQRKGEHLDFSDHVLLLDHAATGLGQLLDSDSRQPLTKLNAGFAWLLVIREITLISAAAGKAVTTRMASVPRACGPFAKPRATGRLVTTVTDSGFPRIVGRDARESGFDRWTEKRAITELLALEAMRATLEGLLNFSRPGDVDWAHDNLERGGMASDQTGDVKGSILYHKLCDRTGIVSKRDFGREFTVLRDRIRHGEGNPASLVAARQQAIQETLMDWCRDSAMLVLKKNRPRPEHWSGGAEPEPSRNAVRLAAALTADEAALASRWWNSIAGAGIFDEMLNNWFSATYESEFTPKSLADDNILKFDSGFGAKGEVTGAELLRRLIFGDYRSEVYYPHHEALARKMLPDRAIASAIAACFDVDLTLVRVTDHDGNITTCDHLFKFLWEIDENVDIAMPEIDKDHIRHVEQLAVRALLPHIEMMTVYQVAELFRQIIDDGLRASGLGMPVCCPSFTPRLGADRLSGWSVIGLVKEPEVSG